MAFRVSVAGELKRDDNGIYQAVFDRRSSCASCLKSAVCGASAFFGDEHRVRLVNSGPGCESATAVAASMPATQLILLAATCYLLPAILCVLSAWVATLILPLERDAAALLGSAWGLALSAAAIRAADVDRWARACVKIRVFASGRS
jgi:positive regulator of sigma E activity